MVSVEEILESSMLCLCSSSFSLAFVLDDSLIFSSPFASLLSALSMTAFCLFVGISCIPLGAVAQPEMKKRREKVIIIDIGCFINCFKVVLLMTKRGAFQVQDVSKTYTYFQSCQHLLNPLHPLSFR